MIFFQVALENRNKDDLEEDLESMKVTSNNPNYVVDE